MFNQYSLYSNLVSTANAPGTQDNKIFVDLQRIKNLRDINDVEMAVDQEFGTFKDTKVFDYPENNLKVAIHRKNRFVMIVAKQKSECILASCWSHIDENVEKQDDYDSLTDLMVSLKELCV